MTPDDQDFYDDGIIALYLGQFTPRFDLYVANGAEVIRHELTADVIRHAITHHYAISAYLGVWGDKDQPRKTHVGAIDYDTDDGLEQARAAQHLLTQHGIPSLVVGSRRGAHLWVTCWDYLSAQTMARALKAAVALSAGQGVADSGSVEVFPKTTTSLGVGALRLPGMPHQRTQQVYPIYQGAEVVRDLTFRRVIDAVDLADGASVTRFAGRAPIRPEYPRASTSTFYGRTRRWSGPNGDEPKASEVLHQLWGVQIRPGSTGRCPKHDDRHGSLTVYKDDMRVFCGSPSCVLNGQGKGVGSIELSRMKA